MRFSKDSACPRLGKFVIRVFRGLWSWLLGICGLQRLWRLWRLWRLRLRLGRLRVADPLAFAVVPGCAPRRASAGLRHIAIRLVFFYDTRPFAAVGIPRRLCAMCVLGRAAPRFRELMDRTGLGGRHAADAFRSRLRGGAAVANVHTSASAIRRQHLQRCRMGVSAFMPYSCFSLLYKKIPARLFFLVQRYHRSTISQLLGVYSTDHFRVQLQTKPHFDNTFK